MHMRLQGTARRRRARGFSLIELMLVAAVGTVVFTAGALAFRVVANNQRAAGSFQSVPLPAATGQNFYGGPLTSVDSYTAPNFGRCSQADVMRTMFLEEVSKSVAVFALPRGIHINTIRGRTLNLYNRLPQSLDTPAAFLAFLQANPDTATKAQVFVNYRGVPPDSATTNYTVVDPDTLESSTVSSTDYVTNASIFLLQPSGSNTQLWIRCVYEIDYVDIPVNPDNPDVPCVFASVRRYVADTLTHYYDVVYRDATRAQAGPAVAHFERADRAVYSETGLDKYKKAGNQPFYLIWWPDPGLNRLRGTTATTYSASTPQAAYAKHEGQTSYFLVVPQFPAF